MVYNGEKTKQAVTVSWVPPIDFTGEVKFDVILSREFPNGTIRWHQEFTKPIKIYSAI